MPQTVIDAIADHDTVETIVERSESALDTAAWSYTPIINQVLLAPLHALTNLVSLDFLVVATDTRVLESLGILIAAKRCVRRIKIAAVGRLWPGATIQLHPSKFDTEQNLCIAHSLSWLPEPLKDSDRMLELEELALENFCVCQSDPLLLSEIVRIHKLRSLKLSCFSILLPMESGLPYLSALTLSFRNGRMRDTGRCLTDWPAEPVALFVTQCHALKSLELVDRPDILEMALSNTFGHNLQSVKVHTTLSLAPLQLRANLPCAVGSSSDYPYRTLELLSQSCRGLRQLEITAPFSWSEVR